MIMVVNANLLFVVAFISSYTAHLLKTKPGSAAPAE